MAERLTGSNGRRVKLCWNAVTGSTLSAGAAQGPFILAESSLLTVSEAGSAELSAPDDAGRLITRGRRREPLADVELRPLAGPSFAIFFTFSLSVETRAIGDRFQRATHGRQETLILCCCCVTCMPKSVAHLMGKRSLQVTLYGRLFGQHTFASQRQSYPPLRNTENY